VNSGLTNTNVTSLAVSGSNLFAGTQFGGVFLSTNSGTNWTQVNTGLTSNIVLTFTVTGSNLFAGTYGGVFLSTNNGTSWIPITSGLTDTLDRALAVSGTNLFVGTSANGVWRRPLSEITSVRQFSTEVPLHFELAQNYPNPFNPTTTIVFSLPSRSFVSLKVFDAIGKEVSTLVSEELVVGTYSQQWDATGLSSGVYFYRLHAGAFIETKRLLLLK
jgi:hypothetical protein